MRFRLVEDVSPRLGDYSNDWQQFNEDEELTDEFIKDFIRKYAGINTSNKEFLGVVKSSINAFGFDPQENQFLSYLITANNSGVKIDPSQVKNLQVISDRALSGQDINKEWYYNSELLNRPYQEFTYVLNIADVLSNSRKASKYFNDIKNKGVKEIFADGNISVNGKIKDAGIGSRDKDTIFGMINQWTKEDAKSTDNYTVKDVIDMSSTSKLFDHKDYETWLLKYTDTTSRNNVSPEARTYVINLAGASNKDRTNWFLSREIPTDSMQSVMELAKSLGEKSKENDTNNKKG